MTTMLADAAERRIEVSADGRLTVELEAEPTDGTVTTRGSAVPFGAAPDWSFNDRRQVGGLRVADMNDDGLPDLVGGCYNSNSFPPYDDWRNFILFNTGTELEATPSWFSTDEVSTGNIDVGLINDDDHPDIFAANGSPYPASVIYFGGASGPSSSPGWSSNEPAGAWNNYAKIFDINHDGYNDVVTANQGASEFDPDRPIFAFMNDNGTLETTPSWQSAIVSKQNYIDFADYDGDGWEDMAISKWSGIETAIYRNINGTLETSPSWTVGNTATDKGVAWSDIDGNGEPDLVVGHEPTQLWTNVGGVLTNTWTNNAPFYSHNEMLMADIDGDGDEELIETHFADGRTHVYLNNNGTLDQTPTWTYDSSNVGTGLAVGDINGDGLVDLVIGYSGEPCVVVFYNQGVTCPADLTGEGNTVDVFDLLELLANWGSDGPGADLAEPNDVVNVFDLLELLASWGPC